MADDAAAELRKLRKLIIGICVAVALLAVSGLVVWNWYNDSPDEQCYNGFTDTWYDC